MKALALALALAAVARPAAAQDDEVIPPPPGAVIDEDEREERPTPREDGGAPTADPDELEAMPAAPEAGSDPDAPPDGTAREATTPEAYRPREDGGFGVALDVVPRGDRAHTARAIRREGSGRRECVAPCRMVLEPGYYDFEIGDGQGRDFVQPDGNPIRIVPGRRSILSVHHDHRAGERVAGWVILTIALHGIAASWLPPALGDRSLIAPLAIGLPVASPFVALALTLMFMQDRARVELFRPSLADR